MKTWLWATFAVLVLISACSRTAAPNPKIGGRAEIIDVDGQMATWVDKLAEAGTPAALPFGNTNDRYNHHTFWDSDVWGFPALALTRPDIAQKQPEFRYRQREAAHRNFISWQAAGYPVTNSKSHTPLPELIQLAGGTQPMMFPWETVNGDELSPNPDTKLQHHVTGGVAWMMHRAIQLGLFDKAKGEEVIKGCAAFYLWRMDKNPDGSYGLKEVVSPDEWHTADNDLYTNAIADWTIRRAYGEKAWPRGRVRFPRRADTFATFDGDDFDTYKQAAALLAVFPLQHPDIEAESAAMYGQYRGRYGKNGPAMAHAIDAVVAARIREPELALVDWLRSWKPYTNGSGSEFRETPKGGESFFLTGAAASVNAVVYGFYGIAIHDGPAPLGSPSIPLIGNGWMSIDPCVPAGIKPLEGEFKVLGARLQIKAERRNDGQTVSTIWYADKLLANNYSSRPRK